MDVFGQLADLPFAHGEVGLPLIFKLKRIKALFFKDQLCYRFCRLQNIIFEQLFRIQEDFKLLRLAF